MKTRAAVLLLCLAGCAAPALAQAQPARPSFAEPALSPDGAEIAFASGGDIWTVPASGGAARLLVTDPATESRPLYAPDGRSLAFVSTRGGGTPNLYLLDLSSGAIRRLTYAEANEQLDGWSADGRWLYFSSPATDVANHRDIFRIPAAGGTPVEVSRERYVSEFHAAPSPAGDTIALMARGLSHAQWWRHGRSHIDETELWLKAVAGDGAYRRLLPGGAKRLWPMWAPGGDSLYYMSDEGGDENLWRLDLAGGAATQLTRFADGRLLWPSMGAGGRAIVFERGMEIWRLDLVTGEAVPVPISLRGAPAAAGQRHLVETNFTSLALSPDGKKVAIVAHGEIFAAASAREGGSAQRISNSIVAENAPIWSPDSRRLLYVSDHGDGSRIVEYDFTTQRERVLSEGAGVRIGPVYSPDGEAIAYVKDARELRVLRRRPDGAMADSLLHQAMIDLDDTARPSWSPDGRWLAVPVNDPRSFTNIWVVPAAGGEARQISFLANGQAGQQIAWAPDGRYLLFDSAQRSEAARIVRVDLIPNVPPYREDAFRDLFPPEQPPGQPSTPAEPDPPASPPPASAAPTPTATENPTGSTRVNIVFEGIRERATLLPLGLSAERPLISPNGKTLLFTANVAGQINLYSYNLDELAREAPVAQQVAASRRPKIDYAFSPDSKDIFFLEGGTVTTTSLESPRSTAIALTAALDVDFDREKQVVFDQAWGLLNRLFYDPAFHGADWAGLRAQWRPFVNGVRTPDEMRRVMTLLIGELNASHLGMNPPAEGFGAVQAGRVGDLGLRFDRETAEGGRGLVIREVVALGPAALEGSVRPGETLVSVNRTAVGPATNLDALLQNQVGRRTVLGIRSAAGREREAIVRPVAPAVARGLLYRQWVTERRAFVDRVSGGRLGYVHIPDMSEQSLAQLYVDLDAQNQAKEGVVIDIRSNNGGFVNGYVLDVFTRRNYMTMTPRDRYPVPARQALGQRAFGGPTILVTNESSLSDAEDFAEGYRLLEVGKIVGVPTSGWIIYTFNQPLIDGSVVRVPTVRIEDSRGQNMELNPRPVDIRVERPLGETLRGEDAQLARAVQELLAQLPAR